MNLNLPSLWPTIRSLLHPAKLPRVLGLGLVLLVLPLSAEAQGRRGGRSPDATEQDYIRQMDAAIKPGFKEDVFTFARLEYQAGGYTSGYGRGGRTWSDDTPDADIDLRWRLFQITSIKVGVGPVPTQRGQSLQGFKSIPITPEALAGFPFAYLAATDSMNLSSTECTNLRNYMLNGGFVMAEDFWGDSSWLHVHAEFKAIFPDLQPVELPLNHPIFHSVFNFKYAPQIPSAGNGFRGVSWDRADYAGDHEAHYYAIYDKKGRMMALLCRNNHFGDGWEHEGENEEYFDKYSMAQAYPMFINILYYTMTH